jgi:hypothetical protein
MATENNIQEYGWEDGQKDPLGHFYADFAALSDKARQVVVDNAVNIANSPIPLSQCDVIAPIWFHIFKEAGVEVELKGGNYSLKDENDIYRSSTEHSWLVVEENIVDPTAGQFGNNIQEDYYQTFTFNSDEWFDGENPDEWKFENVVQEHIDYQTMKDLAASAELSDLNDLAEPELSKDNPANDVKQPVVDPPSVDI